MLKSLSSPTYHWTDKKIAETNLVLLCCPFLSLIYTSPCWCEAHWCVSLSSSWFLTEVKFICTNNLIWPMAMGIWAEICRRKTHPASSPIHTAVTNFIAFQCLPFSPLSSPGQWKASINFSSDICSKRWQVTEAIQTVQQQFGNK